MLHKLSGRLREHSDLDPKLSQGSSSEKSSTCFFLPFTMDIVYEQGRITVTCFKGSDLCPSDC